MECEGCTVRDVCKVSAKIAKKGNLECPCAICLLKGICVDACVDYYEFRIKYRRYKEESYSKNSSKKNENFNSRSCP